MRACRPTRTGRRRKLRVGATSFVTPVRIYDIDLATGERTLLREQPVLGDYRPEEYVERRDWAEAPTTAPGSRSRSCTVPDSNSRLRHCFTATAPTRSARIRSFSIARLSLLDRGMVFVIAHVRGGGEMGRLWYEHGKLLEKKNTFTDFIAVARHLVDNRGDASRAPGGLRRQRGRSADGRGGQHGTGSVRRDPGAGAVRRPADHDPGSLVAADRHRVGRVGKPVERQRCLRLHEVVLARTRTSRPSSIPRSWR